MIRNLMAGLVLSAALLFSPFAAKADFGSLLGTETQNNPIICAGAYSTLSVPCSQSMKAAGVLFSQSASVGTATGTSIQTLQTYTLNANVLDAVGRRIHCEGYYHFATNADNKTITAGFGSETFSSPTAATSNKNGFIAFDVVKTGASTQIVSGRGVVDVTPITPYFATGAETDTGTIAIVFQATDGTSAANDIVLEDSWCLYGN